MIAHFAGRKREERTDVSMVVLGIDLGKNVCTIVGLDADGAICWIVRWMHPVYSVRQSGFRLGARPCSVHPDEAVSAPGEDTRAPVGPCRRSCWRRHLIVEPRATRQRS